MADRLDVAAGPPRQFADRAAFGVASCCALPFLLATLGLGTAWLGGIALLAAPHRLFLLAASALCLVAGAVLLWRQRGAAI
ncbi:MAG: hypothetical protein J0H99_14365, partial [Rhodospirillales bacterium]|nr:hypothetical protein [Rhodospirillales bacterium]